MNKKLLIFIFLLMATPVFAQDIPKSDVVVEETAPVVTEVQAPSQQTLNKSFVDKFKGIFKHSDNDGLEKAKDVEAVQPDELDVKTIDKVKKENKKKAKLAKKQQKEQEKLEKQQKKLAKQEKVEVIQEETPLVDNNEEGKTVLTDTAYQGSVTTNKIIEVDDCVKYALEKHPLIHLAMSNSEVYKSKIAQAWANYFPTFSAGVSYSRNDMQVANFAFPTQVYDMFYTPTVSGNMLLFDFGKTKAQADVAKRTFEASEYNLQTVINSVVFNVKQAYYNLLFAQQQVQVYEDTVKDYSLHLEQANAYYNIGTKPKIDVLTAEYNLGRAKLNLLQAKNTLQVAYVQLSNAMGMPDYSEYDVIDNLTTKAYSIDIKEAVDTAFDTSPALLQAKKKADASEILVRASKRAFAPNINGFASYSRGGKRVDTDYGYQFGAELSYKTVNLLLLKKQVDEAKATHKKDLADYENTKQDIYLQVKQAYLNLVTAQESISVAKLSMDQAKEQYDLASGRYKVGLGDAIELKDAETTFRNAQLDYYNTLLNYHVSAANLEKIMGVPLISSDTELL